MQLSKVAVRILFLILVASYLQAPSGFLLEKPGPALDLTSGKGGKLLMTTVAFVPVNRAQLIWNNLSGSPNPVVREATDTSDLSNTMNQAQDDALLAARHLLAYQSTYATHRLPTYGANGPSAGLMMALSYVQQMSGADLTGGITVAGTGTIEPQGTVGPIGGVDYKVAGAVSAHAQVFLVDSIDEAQAKTAASGTGMRVVAVQSLHEAVTWLCEHTARWGSCTHAGLTTVLPK